MGGYLRFKCEYGYNAVMDFEKMNKDIEKDKIKRSQIEKIIAALKAAGDEKPPVKPVVEVK